MTKIRILALLALVGLLVLWPAVAFAQPNAHRFYGTATLDGTAVSIGSAVAATVGGDTYSTTTTDAAGTYVITVASSDITKSYAGQTVSFTVRGYAATQTATWEVGGVTNLNLTARTALTAPTAEAALASIAGKCVCVWGFDAHTQTWNLYDPANSAISDLKYLEDGKGYWLKVIQDCTLTFGAKVRNLFRGWNLIGW